MVSGRIIWHFLSSRIFKTVVSAVLLTTMALMFGPRNVAERMLSANPLFLAYAVFVFIASGVLGAVQWGIIMKFHGINLGFTGTVARYFMGLFFNYILPGFVGGDIVRVYKTAKASGQVTKSFSSTLADRMIGLLVLVLFSLGAYVFLPVGTADSALPVAVFMLFILSGFLALFVFKQLGELMNRIFGRFIPRSICEKITAVYGEMHGLTRSPATLVAVFTLSIMGFYWSCFI